MKKLKYLLLAVALFISTSAFAAGSVNVIGYTPFAYEKIAVSNLAVSRLNATYRETAGAVFITIESNNIRYRIEGGDPDADDGHLVISAAYQNLWFNDPASIREFRTIAIGGNATLIVTYYRRN
jgi:hypothetical protein